MTFDDIVAKVVEKAGGKAEEQCEALAERRLDWKIRFAAEQRGFFPMASKPITETKIYGTGSIVSAAFDVRRGLLMGGGFYVLFGGKGSGLTTTLHAAVRGRKDDGTKVGCRSIVFDRIVGAKTSEEWLKLFQEGLGKHWVGLSGQATAKKLIGILNDTEETLVNDFLRVIGQEPMSPKFHDPDKVKDLSLDISPLVPGVHQTKDSHKYKNPKFLERDGDRGIIVGFDSIDFHGELEGGAAAFFEQLVHLSRNSSEGLVIVFATSNKAVADEALKLDDVEPMISSIKPIDENGAFVEDVYKSYDMLAKHRDAAKNYKLDPTLRMGTDGKRMEYFLEKKFSIRSEAEKNNLEEALKQKTLKDSVRYLVSVGMSPRNSPEQERENRNSIELGSPKILDLDVAQTFSTLGMTQSSSLESTKGSMPTDTKPLDLKSSSFRR